MSLMRYPTNNTAISTQNGFVDLHDWLGFLCAKSYLHDLLVRTHGFTSSTAERRAKSIIPHVRVARGYIQQSLEGPKELAFLPTYYSILNLSKVAVLLGPRHADLSTQRLHGASYDPNLTDPRSVLTDAIKVHNRGVFPLFHETLTGRAAITKSLRLEIKEILPCVSGISHEYVLATGRVARFCGLQFGLRLNAPNQHLAATVFTSTTSAHGMVPATTRCVVPCLDSFKHRKGHPPSVLMGPKFDEQNGALDAQVTMHVKRYLLLRRSDERFNRSYALMGPNKIEFPEEIPIWLLFYYMSSVVRYKPEFFSRLKDSKYWPPLSAATTHSFLDFLLAFWSYMHKMNYFLVAP
jgi:hypothetical protein